MNDAKKAANAGLEALAEFLNADGERLRTPRSRRLAAILARDARGAKTDLVKLRAELKTDIAGLLMPAKQQKKAFIDLSPEGNLEALLNKAYQLRPKFVSFRVSRFGRSSKHFDDDPFTFIDLGGKGFLVEMVTHDSSARRAFYRILDAAIHDNSFSKLRVCPRCKTFFLGRRCARCARNERNRYMKKYMSKWREEQSRKNKQRERATKHAARLNRFQSFLNKAFSGKTELEIEVGSIIKRLGGWDKINRWNGKRAADIWPALTQRERDFFE